MQAVSESLGLLWEALFLQPEPYVAMRDRENPAGKGLVILILLGIVLALAAFVGSILNWASSPDLAAVQETVLKNLQQMSWWQFVEMDSEGKAVWFQIWDSIWQVISFMNPTPVSSLAGFISQPLNLVITWFIFGLVANPIAKLFDGQGHFSQTLGTTALAAAPQLLGVFHVVPFVVLAGIGVWTLLARYMAIRVTHGLSWGRTLWVTVLTMLVIFLIKVLLIAVGSAAFGTAMAASFGGGL